MKSLELLEQMVPMSCLAKMDYFYVQVSRVAVLGTSLQIYIMSNLYNLPSILPNSLSLDADIVYIARMNRR